MPDRKALRACSAAVRGALQGVALDGVDHQHARYKIAVTAAYHGRVATAAEPALHWHVPVLSSSAPMVGVNIRQLP